MELREEKITSERLYNGRILNLRRDTVRLPDGKVTMREVCEHTDGVAVLAIDDKGRCAVVKQYRYPIGTEIYEIPAGKLDKEGEDPMEGAIRELREEAGVTAGKIEHIGSIYPSPGCMTEMLHLYLATELTHVGQSLDEGEFLDLSWISLDEIKKMALSGELKDAKALAAVMLYDARRGA